MWSTRPALADLYSFLQTLLLFHSSCSSCYGFISNPWTYLETSCFKDFAYAVLCSKCSSHCCQPVATTQSSFSTHLKSGPQEVWYTPHVSYILYASCNVSGFLHVISRQSGKESRESEQPHLSLCVFASYSNYKCQKHIIRWEGTLINFHSEI